MRQSYDEFRRLGADVLLVTQARPEFLTMFLRDQPLPFPAVADPTRQLYRAFGLERTSWIGMLRWGAALRFFGLLFRGWSLRMPYKGEDVLQLGGDFILDAQGRLIYAFRSAEPTDRTKVEVLLQAIRGKAESAIQPAL